MAVSAPKTAHEKTEKRRFRGNSSAYPGVTSSLEFGSWSDRATQGLDLVTSKT